MSLHRELLIGVAALLASIVVIGMFIHTSMNDPLQANQSQTPPAQAKDRAAELQGKQPRWMRTSGEQAYEEIPGRNLFRQARPETKPASDDPGVLVAALPPARLETRYDQAQAPVHTPEIDRITVVGRVVLDGVEQAVVEDMSRGETRFVPVGGTAFDYRFTQLTPHGATLERDGKTYTIAYGANKPEPQTRAPARTRSIVAPAELAEGASRSRLVEPAGNEATPIYNITEWESQ